MWRLCFLVALFLITVLNGISCAPSLAVNFPKEKIETIKMIARHVKDSIDFDVDPCIDYYAHICRSFNKSNPVFVRSVDLENFFEWDNLFPSTDKRIDAEVKMENFLYSCKMGTEIMKEFAQKFNFPQSIGGWPVYDKSWSGSKFDLALALGELKRHGIEAIIALNFEQLYQGNIIKISGQKKRIYEEKKFQRILVWFDIAPNDRLDLMKDCSIFEEEYFQALSTIPNELPLNTTLSELKKKLPDFDWSKYIRTVAGRNVNDDFPVLLYNVESLAKVLQKVVHSDKKVLGNYLFCTFADSIYTHVMEQKSCYLETYINFHPVVHRLIKDSFYNDETHDYFLSVMKSLLDGLISSIDVFDGESSESVLQPMEQILKDEFVPSLTEESVNKEFEGLEIHRENYSLNVFNLYKHKMEKFCDEFFSKDKKGIIHRVFSPQIFMQTTYNSFNRPSSVVFTLLGMPFLAESIFYYRKLHGYSDPVRECFKRQLNVSKQLDMSDIHGIEGTDIYVRGYNDWAKKNQKLIQKEDEILEEFGFNNKKMFFALAMQNACGYGDSEVPHKIILSTLGNLKDFSEEYNCPVGSPMNPDVKCSYD